ncbi:uncharacterized protein DEA37_0005833 [Paragonimus westermani]|uniref:Integrase catalytic domain-containing protein n=1 Tax=Paragonimus westermani TaxID=34504 RepID=A0A5J4NG17_9TREM|nr:uncharacterized protein DEA37_0005833 [Paragonimus westermani]
MHEDAVHAAAYALENFQLEKDIAVQIKKEFDRNSSRPIETIGQPEDYSHVKAAITNQGSAILSTQVSSIPSEFNDLNRPITSNLRTANRSTMKLFGQSPGTLNLGLRQSIRWFFTIVVVQMAIVDIDLLQHFEPPIDFRRLHIVDHTTKLAVTEILTDKPLISPVYQSSPHGCPATFTADRGPQFEGGSFAETLNALGCHSTRTTAYHPAANGMVERFHRQLKLDLAAVDAIRWTDSLPMVLLGIHAAPRAGRHVSRAELIYSQPLRPPGNHISRATDTLRYDASYAEQLASHMRRLHVTDKPEQNRKAFVPENLHDCMHVCLRPACLKRTEDAFNVPPHPSPRWQLSRNSLDQAHRPQQTSRLRRRRQHPP